MPNISHSSRSSLNAMLYRKHSLTSKWKSTLSLPSAFAVSFIIFPFYYKEVRIFPLSAPSWRWMIYTVRISSWKTSGEWSAQSRNSENIIDWIKWIEKYLCEIEGKINCCFSEKGTDGKGKSTPFAYLLCEMEMENPQFIEVENKADGSYYAIMSRNYPRVQLCAGHCFQGFPCIVSFKTHNNP